MDSPESGVIEGSSAGGSSPSVGISGGLLGMTGEGMFAETVIVK